MAESKKALTLFDRSGIAALSDLESVDWKDQFRFLEQKQNEFLAKEAAFRSPEYKWPLDALHTWSRVWEYPYVYHHLQAARSRLHEATQPVVVDFGSGVTFFPFAVAQLGYRVICSDIDPVCQKDLAAASRALPSAPGKVEFRLLGEKTSAFQDAEVDIIYCVSVLEHIPDFEKTIVEFSRMLKKGGLLILTIDLDLRGDSELGAFAFKRLQNALALHFDLLWPDVTIHPTDMLLSNNGPYQIERSTKCKLMIRNLIHHVIKPILGRKTSTFFPNRLAVHGVVLAKR
jgi:2-polyprenyl-3-methyl-5-hydroxy-6-metoxy-1,4-benzoquinol methylase